MLLVYHKVFSRWMIPPRSWLNVFAGCCAGLFCVFAGAAEIPEQPLATKGRLIFSDDFSRDTFGSVWTERIKSAGVENGVLFGRQTTKEHGSVASTKLALPDPCMFMISMPSMAHLRPVLPWKDELAAAVL